MWHMDNIDIIFSFYFFTSCICTIISYIYSCVCCIDPGALLLAMRLTWPLLVEHKIKCIICWYTEYILGREEGKQTWCNNNNSRLHGIPMSDEASNTSCVTSETQTGVCESVCRVIKRFCMQLKVCTAASASHRTLYGFPIWIISKWGAGNHSRFTLKS